VLFVSNVIQTVLLQLKIIPCDSAKPDTHQVYFVATHYLLKEIFSLSQQTLQPTHTLTKHTNIISKHQVVQ